MYAPQCYELSLKRQKLRTLLQIFLIKKNERTNYLPQMIKFENFDFMGIKDPKF